MKKLKIGRQEDWKTGRLGAPILPSFHPSILYRDGVLPQMLFFLLILVSVPVFAGADIDIPEPADLGLVEEKLLLKAIEAAQKKVRRSPDDADVWGQLGHVYLSHGWEVAAIPCYRQASRCLPDEFKWLYFLGRLTKQRQPEDAVKHLTRALTLDPEYAPAHLYLASALRILGKFDEARQHLERAKHLQPNNPFSELWLGEIALARQQVKLARTHLERALRLNPGQSEAHVLMAQVAIALGDKQLAKKHAEAARNPSQYGELTDPLWWDVLKAGVTAPLYAERGRRYMSEGDYASAVAEFGLLISDTQKDIEVWLNYGISLLHTERYNDALEVFVRMQSILHNDADIRKERSANEIAYLKAQVYNYMGQIYYETGQIDIAIRACQQALQFGQFLSSGQENDKPQRQSTLSDYVTFFSNVHANLAMVYENTGQLEEAIAHYQKALELHPTKPSLHRDLAGVYWKKRRYSEAESHYKQVIAHDVTDVQAIYRLGLIFLAQGRYLEAVTQFKRAIAIDAAHVHAYGALGVAYQKLGNIPEAINTFETVLQLEPGNKVALEMLKELHESK